MRGWPKEWCETCIFTRFPRRFHALYELHQRCLEYVSGGMGPGIWRLSPMSVKWKLEVNDIPREHWKSIDDALDLIHDEWTRGQEKSVAFDERDYAELTETG
jgi:hypothetical protein